MMYLEDDGKSYPNESVLSDDYPVYADYVYVVDGRVERSDVGGTVARLRADIRAQGRTADLVCRCNIVARQDEHREKAEQRAPATSAGVIHEHFAKSSTQSKPQDHGCVHNRGGWRKKRKG